MEASQYPDVDCFFELAGFVLSNNLALSSFSKNSIL